MDDFTAPLLACAFGQEAAAAELIEATKLAGALDLPVAHSGGEGSMCDMRGTDTELGSGADTKQQRERGKRGGGAGRRGGERGAWGR